MTTIVVDRHGRLTDETLAALEEALIAHPDVMATFLDDLAELTRPTLKMPAAFVAAGIAGAATNRALTDENLPEEVPAIRPGERTP